MKQIISVLVSAIILLSCNNQGSHATEKGNSADTTIQQAAKKELSEKTACADNLLFKEGVVIESASYDAKGKIEALNSSTVKKVYSEGGITISEMDMKATNAEGKNEQTLKASYKCDGENFIMDMASFLNNKKQGSTISTSGLLFPLSLKAGQLLPNAKHEMNISSGNSQMKLVSLIKERKVEARESITIPAGTFTAYKISSVVEANTESPGMTEEMKKSMESVRANMPKPRFIVWYAPELTVLKMEMYLGENLVSRTEVTNIKEKK